MADRESVVSAAQPIGNEVMPQGVLRVVNAPLPQYDGTNTLPLYQQLFDAQATKVLDILLLLPGGTLDRVLAKLLSRAVSLHRIPWEPIDPDFLEVE